MRQVLLDVWGVLHDGQVRYPDAQRFLDRALAARVRVDLVTNASWSGAVVEHALQRMGLRLDAVTSIWTAGDVARRIVVERSPARLTYEGRADGAWLVEGFERVPVEQAELVVFADPTPRSGEVLQTARERGIPVLCANPDAFIEDRNGVRTAKAGLLASEHERQGGEVLRAGKPDPRIFELARAEDDVLLIGDSPTTDLAGGLAAGIPTLWLVRRSRSDETVVARRYRPIGVERTLDGVPL